MKYLALDIGKRQTGVAFGDASIGIPLPLSTIRHIGIPSLVDRILPIVKERKIDEVIIGLPLLPSGKKGSQVLFIEKCAKELGKNNVFCSFVDERYTTPRMPRAADHAYAACAILETKFMLGK